MHLIKLWFNIKIYNCYKLYSIINTNIFVYNIKCYIIFSGINFNVIFNIIILRMKKKILYKINNIYNNSKNGNVIL